MIDDASGTFMQDRQRLRALVLARLASAPGPIADADYFAGLRRLVDGTGLTR